MGFSAKAWQIELIEMPANNSNAADSSDDTKALTDRLLLENIFLSGHRVGGPGFRKLAPSVCQRELSERPSGGTRASKKGRLTIVR